LQIAFQPKRISLFPQIIIEQGNHAITYGPDRTAIQAIPSIGLFHIPIDGLDQLEKKILNGVEAYEKHTIGNKTVLGGHWMEMQKVLQNGAVSNQLLNSFIANYGDTAEIQSLIQRGKPLLSRADLKKQKYRKFNLSAAGAYKADRLRNPDIKISKNIKKIVRTSDGEIKVSGRLKVGKNRQSPNFFPENGVKIPKLPENNSLLSSPTKGATLNAFVAESYHRIETLTQTAWGGHIPFMFSLISELRPRRYVELGTQYGASFFAACQMLKHLGLPSLAIAIDLWEGDSQAGFYGEEVYNNFEHLRNTRYKNQSRSIRSLFSDAANHFEDSSVDLIHIDGLHTYEAVKEDYNIWKPKLTKNGVMIFHDTNEYLSTYGVWDFFAEIRSKATESFDFKHAHGLGVLAFGDDNSNPMISILRQMNKNPTSVELHFSRLGELSVKEALYQLQIQNVNTFQNQDQNCEGFGQCRVGNWLKCDG
jgi:predicted O-methyltransferase YrrM